MNDQCYVKNFTFKSALCQNHKCGYVETIFTVDILLRNERLKFLKIIRKMNAEWPTNLEILIVLPLKDWYHL